MPNRLARNLKITSLVTVQVIKNVSSGSSTAVHRNFYNCDVHVEVRIMKQKMIQQKTFCFSSTLPIRSISTQNGTRQGFLFLTAWKWVRNFFIRPATFTRSISTAVPIVVCLRRNLHVPRFVAFENWSFLGNYFGANGKKPLVYN